MIALIFVPLSYLNACSVEQVTDGVLDIIADTSKSGAVLKITNWHKDWDMSSLAR